MTDSPAAPTAETMELALRLAHALGSMRSESVFGVKQFCDAVEAGMGGTALLKAPSERAKREVSEARYMPEGSQVEVTYNFG